MSEIRPWNIGHDIFSCERVYDTERAWLELKAHDAMEIDMILVGSGIHLVLGQAIPCKAGDIFVTPPGIPHRYFLESREDGLTVRRLSLFSEGQKETDEAIHGCFGLFQDGSVTAYAMMNRAMTERVSALYDAIEEELRDKGKAWQDAVYSNLSLLLIHVARYIDSSIKNSSPVSPGEWNLVLTAMRMMQSNCADAGLTLRSIADTFGVSAANLSRIFTRLTGKRFADHLREMRFERACELLRESDLNVEDIVGACGLRDLPSFYKNFGARMGMTPNEYRQKVKQPALDAVMDKKTKTREEKIMVILSEISENLQKGKAKIVKEMVQQAIDEGADPEKILNEGLLDGMSIIGEKFKNNEVYVPEVLVAARAMNMGVQVLKPYLVANGVKATGKVCIGTVQGDLHDIGKNLVKMMMEGKGLEVIDLGTDVAPETFVQTAIDEGCQVICCSALLTTTMGVMGDVVKAAEAAGIRDKVKILIGGAPVNEAFCKQIGADCYTVDAASAADTAVELCK